MKKNFSLLFAILAISLWWSAFAYTPTAADTHQAQLLQAQLIQITSGNNQDKWNYYAQIQELQDKFYYDGKLNYLLQAMGDALITPLNADKAKAKQAALPFKQAFLSGYLTWLKDISGTENCTGRYNTLDSISFANNFPTALTVATRYREVGCTYYLPANGYGPFQIVSKNYGSGLITRNIFQQSVQDFINFSKAKRAQYNSKLWISLTYTWWDRTGLVNHAWLYNGGVISGNVVIPNNPRYLYDGYGDAYSGATRYGLLPKFLKLLQREISN